MRLDELDFHLSPELIAEHPVEPRDECRLMVVHRKTGRIEHRSFKDLGSYLQKGDLLVLNSARVTPARVFAQEEGNENRLFEILVVNPSKSTICRAMVSPFRKVKPGAHLKIIGHSQVIQVESHAEEMFWNLKIEGDGVNWLDLLEQAGHMPLPPYVLQRRKIPAALPEDRLWYQTAYADRDGAIAAPTAGLHFTIEMLEQLKSQGVDTTRIFLKVGIGTFQPVRTDKLEEHVLRPEEYEVGFDAAEKINQARSEKRRIVAVGTTTVRTLEFCGSISEQIKEGSGSTNLFIFPPYQFQMVDVMMTNFHLPKSTLLALVFAFAGKELIKQAYAEAIEQRYRFFSYGDAMLIL